METFRHRFLFHNMKDMLKLPDYFGYGMKVFCREGP